MRKTGRASGSSARTPWMKSWPGVAIRLRLRATADRAAPLHCGARERRGNPPAVRRATGDGGRRKRGTQSAAEGMGLSCGGILGAEQLAREDEGLCPRGLGGRGEQQEEGDTIGGGGDGVKLWREFGRAEESGRRSKHCVPGGFRTPLRCRGLSRRGRGRCG